jgi:serine/threonine protein kinase
MFDSHTGVPTSKAAEDVISMAWTKDEDVTSTHEFRIPYTALEKATYGFSPTMRIGGGGSCEVFRGKVYTVNVAIKVLNQDQQTANAEIDWSESMLSLEGKEFYAEMSLLKSVKHPNICRLLAVSLDGPKRWYKLELQYNSSL